MSATRRNGTYFRADRENLATWIPVCRHTFVSCFPDIDGPRTDDIQMSVVLIPTFSGNLHNRSPQQQTAQKIIRRLHPLACVFTFCRVVASCRTHFGCGSFGWLLRCLSAPCCRVPSRLSPCHVVPLRLVSRRRCCRFVALSLCRVVTLSRRRVVASLHRCVVASLSRRVVASSHRRVVASLRRCVVASLRRCVVASMRRCIVASLHRCIVASSRHRVIASSRLISPHRCIVPPDATRHARYV
jgi:hypothetical protein